jgi:hypothetical protein
LLQFHLSKSALYLWGNRRKQDEKIDENEKEESKINLIQIFSPMFLKLERRKDYRWLWKIFLLKSCCLPIKSHKTWKKTKNKFPSFTLRRRLWQKFAPHLHLESWNFGSRSLLSQLDALSIIKKFRFPRVPTLLIKVFEILSRNGFLGLKMVLSCSEGGREKWCKIYTRLKFLEQNFKT